MQDDDGQQQTQPLNRLFVVCGRAVEADELQEVFQVHGNVSHVKQVKEKGVAYITFDKASSAARAIENLNGAVLKDGKGAKLKVLIADPVTTRGAMLFGQAPAAGRHSPEAELSDPDNTPPRSRLFIVVPKQADERQLQEHMAQYPDLEYCKTDLVQTKGCIFAKFSKSSSALQAMEDVWASGTVAGYKVKCMLAEPKSKRPKVNTPPQQETFQAKLDFGMHNPLSLPMDSAAAAALHMRLQQLQSLTPGSLGAEIARGLSGFTPLDSLNSSLQNLQGVNNLADVGLGSQVPQGYSGLGGLSPGSPNNVSHDNSPEGPKKRLFVVVDKGVSDDVVARLFKRFPGMEYCDLKRDKETGKSKGICFVNYSTPEVARDVISRLHLSEFPPHSGRKIKVMYAEPLHLQRSTTTSTTSGTRTSPSMSASLLHSPLSRNMSPDVAIVEQLAGLSMQRTASHGNLDQDLAARITSPASSGTLNNLGGHTSPAASLPARELFGAL